MIEQNVSSPSAEIFPAALQRRLRPWLWVLLVSVGIAGFFAFFLAAGRTPGVAEWIGVQDIFNVALVVHVDLSVLLWFLGITIVTWNLWLPQGERYWFPNLAMHFAAACFMGSICAIALSPWHGGEVIKSNYVPVITNPVFYLGLALLAMGTMLAGAVSGTHLHRHPEASRWPDFPARTLQAGVAGSALLVTGCIAGLFRVLPQLDRSMGEDMFFERLFWGPGHLLQFANTQTTMLLWLLLASSAGLGALTARPLQRRLLWLNALLGALALPVLLGFSVDDERFVPFFTLHMRWAAGIAPGILLLGLLTQIRPLWRARGHAAGLALLVSFAVFFTGGALGWLIDGSDTTVPGHYHGSIGGITAAVMGFVYLLLPRLGHADVARWKSARIQLVLYGTGQILHACGLAWSGGYGALRKTVETGGMTAGKAFFAKAVIGAGGGFAILGGVLFILVCLRAMWPVTKSQARASHRLEVNKA